MEQPIEAARAFGKPPCQFILEDPTWVTFTKWDIKIATGYEIAKSAEMNGWPLHIDQSPRVWFEVKERKSKSQAALDEWQAKERKRLEKKGAKPKYGVIPVAVPVTIDGGPLPTRQDWLDGMRDGLAADEKRLTDGTVVKVGADPEKMAEYRERLMRGRSNRDGPVADKLDAEA